MSAMHAPVSLAEVRKQRKADHRTEVADLRMELEARRSEAIRLVIDAQPLLSRLELIAHEVGPVAFQHVAALRGLLARHAARWEPEPDDDGAAA